MTCGQRADCTLCELTPQERAVWTKEPLSPGPLAYEGSGQLAKSVEFLPSGAGRVKYYQANHRYAVRLCRGCLDRVLGKVKA